MSENAKKQVVSTQCLAHHIFLARKYPEILAEWQMQRDQSHLMLCDNAANMDKAMRDASLPSIGCIMHTLQLVVHNGVIWGIYWL